jgi:hypothetical protein
VKPVPDDRDKTPVDDDRLVIPLDPEVALRALLKVDPTKMPLEVDKDNQRATGER